VEVSDVVCCQKQTISTVFEWLRERLLLRDQLSVFSSSQVIESMLELEMMRYVSSAYLSNMLAGVRLLGSAALTTYAMGQWHTLILAEISTNAEVAL